MASCVFNIQINNSFIILTIHNCSDLTNDPLVWFFPAKKYVHCTSVI